MTSQEFFLRFQGGLLLDEIFQRIAPRLVFHSLTQIYLSPCLSIEEGLNQMKLFTQFFLWTTFGLATLTMGCAEMNGGSMGGGGSTTPSASSAGTTAVTTGPSRVSQGTQGDSLDSCLARIPGDASAGQRMIAEGTCQRDADNRSSIDAVPGQ